MLASDASQLRLDSDGAFWARGAVLPQLQSMQHILSELPENRAGVRIGQSHALSTFLRSDGAIGSVIAPFLGHRFRAVRAILFDKTPTTNWSLAWHQDRTICVRNRVEVVGFSPWTIKQGMHHVSPPYELLVRMLTARVHLDDVPSNNAPLLIAPGSHKVGVIPIDKVQATVQQYGSIACLAKAGDVWLYSTPILHASEAASEPIRRRVLQLDFSADELPDGLEWADL